LCCKGFIQLNHIHLLKVRLACFNSFLIAGAGAKPIMRGSTPTVVAAMILARVLVGIVQSLHLKQSVSCCTIINARCIARSDCTVCFHHAFKFG
jgi:hypothetical protein